ncbi:MAG: HAD family phosphatase [Ruminococcaceae bacterium]|nr:HAD family phosphatase [Oscillospiraceae bacterium]
MIRLAAFDLDCTLAPHGKGILAKNIELLKQIEACGVQIVICSGKPLGYLCGMFRQVELQEPIFVGEVGARIQFGVNYPPKHVYTMPYDAQAPETLACIKQEILQVAPHMWFQPNEINLSPFPQSEAEYTAVKDVIARNQDRLANIHIEYFSEVIDFIPKPICKRAALEYLSDYLNISPSEMIAVGDSANDYSMFEYAATSIGIQLKEPQKVTVSVQNCTQALEYILSCLS